MNLILGFALVVFSLFSMFIFSQKSIFKSPLLCFAGFAYGLGALNLLAGCIMIYYFFGGVPK